MQTKNKNEEAMSKDLTVDKEKVTKETNNVAEKVDHDAKWKEVRESLVLQLKNHLDQAEYHKTMATKAQGAIEVGDQMHPQQEENKEN